MRIGQTSGTSEPRRSRGAANSMWALSSVMMVAPAVRARGQGVAIGAPVGVGCGTFVFVLAMLVVFYVAIWPSL